MKNKRNLKLNKASIRLVIELLLITVSIFVLTNTSGANYVFNSLMAGAEGELAVENNESLTAAAAVSIDTMAKLVDYANSYTGANQYDTITINIIQDTVGMESFTGIGTADAPFGGKLTVSAPLTLDTPLFNYVYDSAEISAITISRTQYVDAPLLAANVVHGGNNTVETAWSVTNSKYYDSNGVEQLHPYAGVIGTIGADAEVNLTINNTATNIKSAGDVGLACQTMGKGSTLKVNVVSAAYSVDAGGYAGGLVGSAENAKVIFGDGVSISSTVKGTLGSGGIFGYYKNDITGVSNPTDPSAEVGNVIDISSYNVNCSLNGTTAGGFIGVLENSGDMTIKSDVNSVVKPVITSFGTAANGVYGGLIGAYSSNSLSHSLTIKDIVDGVVNATNSGNTDTNYAQYFGGVIGKIDGAAYVKMDNVSVTAAGSTKINNVNGKAFGGLVGYINGAFIDANNVKISSDNFYGGGIIGTMEAGVLRLSGTTDLSAAQASSDNKNIVRGQIVGKRGNQALIYAKAGWQLIRSDAVAVDDIGTWGEVLRFGTLAESDVLDVDDTQHTVTVKPAQTTVLSLADFAKLALNIQMNSGTPISTDNALCFDSASLSSTLLTSDITLSADIDLTGTGITGLTRDDGRGADGGDNSAVYTRTFNGGGHTITLATGEVYGKRKNGEIFSDIKSENAVGSPLNAGNGAILRHHYNGLFAKVGNGAKFYNLTVAGNINVYFFEGSNYYCGGLAAYCLLGNSIDNVTFAAENVTSDVTIRYHSSNNGSYHLLGGFIGGTEGKTNDSSITLSFTKGCRVNTTIDDNSTNNSKLICGGIIGDLATSKNVSVTVDNLTLSAKASNNSTSDGKKIGGLIGNISNYGGNDDPGTRVMTLTNITVDGTEINTNSKVDNNNSIKGGALIGEAWNNINVTIGSETTPDSGITVKNGTVIQSGNGDMAGLVTAATGYWKVYDIKIQSLTATGANVRSFGLLINKGIFNDYSKEFALYLEFAKENAYQITSSGINLDGLNANAVFDEILTTCSGRYDTTNTVLESNKCAVVSIRTSGDKLIMDGAGCNTYQNQTGRGISNPNTRYYYNLDAIRSKVEAQTELTPPEKLLLWSVATYAYSGSKSSIKSYFSGHNFSGNTIPAAEYDMTGYSYYPVDSSGVTVSGGCTFKFCNTEIESGENRSDVGDTLPRSTVDSSSQHYLMHFGLFRNVSGNLAVNSSISLSGSVGNSVEYCGALVCGQLTGTGNEINGVELNGIKVNGIDNDPEYAPLLVNTIPTETTVTFSNIRAAAAAYSAGSAAATSLIGNVGGTNADHISITFSNIVLDGRKAANTLTDLDTAYNTTKSIFTKATLLNSFVYTSGKSCTAVYNYTHAEDWEEPLHQVTYGAEIISSTEYAGKQEYYVDAEKYTNPENSNGDRYTAFADDYLPYVATAYNAANNLHEIKVNHKKAADLNVGCGTYNDPYIITTGSQLTLVADILGGIKPEKDVEINYKAGNYNAWCDSKNSHTTYTWDGSTSWKSSGDSSTMSLDEMAKALATAYYMIDNDSINLPVSFVGIGKSTPFKGVIVGKNKDTEGNPRIPIIVNKSTSPLIYNSIGSVIKDLTINVAADFSNSLKDDANATYITDGGTTEFYGGVFGIVNGGDNIIDNVSVNFVDFEDSEGNSVNSASTININSGSNPGNKAVGGYIGVVRYGGVFFRNMGNCPGITSNSMFNATGDFKDSNNRIWLYCNPIIGRVIDGFAVTETGAYNGDAATVTMQNGTKNYSITDIKQSADRIDFDNFTTGKTSSINVGTVKISDAQQLFILGCISMSGAGSAPLGGEYGTSYSYGNNQMTRHADYSAVGTNNTKDETTDFKSSSTDNFSKNTVPYIIYHYTDVSANNNKNGEVQFPARSITNNNCVFNIELTNSEYKLPAGFRGIGSLNNSSDDLKMYINGIKGNHSQIVLNMSFYAYRKDYDKYYTTNNNINENCVGLGLFNSLSQNNSNVINSADIDNEDKTIKNENAICNLTISGSINYEIYDYDNKNNIILAGRDNTYNCCSGGLAGTATAKSGQSNIRLKNVKTENLTINARHIVGGLIGFAKNGTVRMEECNVDEFTITKNANTNVGAVNAGGLIGYVNGCGVDIIGGTFQSINITTGEQAKGWSGNEGIAGLIGRVDSSGKTITVDGVNITNIGINTRGNGFFVGSVLGCCVNGNSFIIKKVSATNVNINNINNSNDFCGGLIGGTKSAVGNFMLTDSHVNTHTDGETNTRGLINGATVSGGIFGYCGSNLTMDSCSIENYDLRSTTNSKYSDGIGALVAKAEGEKTVIIKNCKASDCVLTAVKASGDSYKPMGRIIGSAYEKSKVYGYNIVLDNVKMQLTDGNSIADNDTYIGDIIGELRNTNANNAAIDVYFVGVSMTRDDGEIYVGKNQGRIQNKGNIRVIYSDYNGTCLSGAPNIYASSVNSTSNVADMGASPYATVNPRTDIGHSTDTMFLTGDGAAAYESTAAKIISDVKTNAPYSYKNISADVTKFSAFESKMSTFKTKTANADISKDFPVLVINDSNYQKITDMINSYIHILTNDDSITNYAVDNSSVYNVEFTTYRLENNSHRFVTSEEFLPTLMRDTNGCFKMTDKDYDSSHEQFTLIDIQYFAPNDTSKIAYHLYIPVYVEKMLKFNFKAGALSGTTYNADFYENGMPIMENYGTPVTSHITYSYLRTEEEWANAINNGENLLKAYGKTITVTKNTIPNDTQLVLVDKNNNGRAYYSSYTDAASEYLSTDDKLNFDSFMSSDGEKFSPVPFIDLLSVSANITANADANGTLAKCDAADVGATVRIGEQYYRLAESSDTEKYSVTVAAKDSSYLNGDILKVDEEYYLSIFTKEDNAANIMKTKISCAFRLGDDGMIPSHLNNNGATECSVYIVLGNLYDQSLTFITDSIQGGGKIFADPQNPNNSNNKIKAELKTTISLKSQDVVDYLKSDLIHLYHSFIIEATITDPNGSEKGIKGSPRVTGTYKVESNSYPQNIHNAEMSVVLCGNVNDTLVDIKSGLINGNSVTISCTDLMIEYPDDASIIAQFPQRSPNDTTTGVTYSASSNLAYVADNIENSSMSVTMNDGSLYYRENISSASLSYNVPAITANDLTILGINGREVNDKVNAAAYYNVKNIPQTDMNKAAFVKLRLELYRKGNDGGYTQVDIKGHLNGVCIYYAFGGAQKKGYFADDTGGAYALTIQKAEIDLYDDGLYEIETSFDVKTGAEFESGNLTYANYKVKLTAELLDESGNYIENTNCSDYIIYTNAKICTDMLQAS